METAAAAHRKIAAAREWFAKCCDDDAAEHIYYLNTGIPEKDFRVPVTAKLSRKFYEQLGDDIATELVDWFNAVDATYQQQLREINDLNWERYKAYLEAEIAKLRSELRAEMAAMRTDLQAQIAALRVDMAAMRADIIKWMFVFWCGNMIGLGGLIVALKLF